MRYFMNDKMLIPCGYCTGTCGSTVTHGDVAMFDADNVKIPMIKHLRDAHFPGLGLKHAKMIVEEMIQNGQNRFPGETPSDTLRARMAAMGGYSLAD